MPAVPKLHAVEEREGRPGHRPIPEGVRLPAAPPAEPNWLQLFPVTKGPRAAANARCRRIARDFWRRVVAQLDAQHVLAEIDFAVLARAAVLWARIDQAERQISIQGLTVETDRGMTKNQATTIANQCTEKLMPMLRELGMTPLARDRLNPRGGAEDDDDGWDA